MATLFGRYEYAGEIGRGATGRVFAVVDRSSGGERRAVKVVPPADAGRLIWEFSRLCQIDHPRVARVRELARLESDAPPPLGLSRGTLLLVEDFVEGARLSSVFAQLAESQDARLELAFKVAIAVADALTALHGVSLVHGDVKPDNVLTDVSGESVTLIDLGFARPPALGAVPRGTPSYMAPELFAGVCTPAADVYALGALLYDCLRGEAAAPVSSRGELPWRPRDLLVLERSFDPAVTRGLAQLLAADPEQRPADGRAALSLLLPLAVQLGLAPAQPPLSYAGLSFAPSAKERSERARTLPFTGHAAAMQKLAAALSRDSVVLVRGPEGAGRSRLVREAIRQVQEHKASRGERVPTWVSSLEALGHLRGVDAILWLQIEDGRELAANVRAASIARLSLPSLQVVAVCAPEQTLEGAEYVDVGALASDDFELLLGRLLAPDKPEAGLVVAARAASAGLSGRLCDLVSALSLEQRDLRDARLFQARAPAGSLPVLTAPARELGVALAWWGSALAPSAAGRLLGGEEPLGRAYDELRGKALLAESAGELVLVPRFAAHLRAATSRDRATIARRIEAAGALPSSGFAYVAVDDLEAARAAFFAEVRGLRRAGRSDAACELLHDAARYIDDAQLSLLLADAERARGGYVEGLAALESVPGEASALLRAELLRLSDRAPEARLVVDGLMSATQRSVVERARALSARLTFDAGDLEAARREAEAVATSSDREVEVRALEVEVLARLYAGDVVGAPVDRLVERASARVGESDSGSQFLERAPGRALALRAQVLNARGERTRALGDLRAAVEHMRARGEAHEAATYALNLGLLELESGELGPALETLQEAAQRLSRMLRSRDLGRVLFNFAGAALLVGDFERARVVLDEAERELTRAPDHVARAFIAVLRSELLLSHGAFESAEGAIERGLSELPDELRSLRPVLAARAAQVALSRGALERAEQRLREGQACAPDGDANTLLELATAELQVALAHGDGERAERAVQRGLAVVGTSASERASFAERLRFMLSAIEAARLRSGALAELALRERTALARALLERALATLPRELRAKMRSVPAYARVLTAENSVARASSESDTGRWRALVRSSRRMFAEVSSTRVAQRVAEIALELVHAERALVISFGEGTQLSIIGRAELTSDSERLAGFSRSVVERVALEGRSLLTIEARADDRFETAESVQALHVRSVLCVELLGLGERAFIYLDDRLRPSAFGAEDLALIEDLAEIARQALRASEQLRSESRRARLAEQRQKRLSRELARTQATRSREPGALPLVGDSAVLARVIATARRVAVSDAPVLITGESGTGKELLARFVHDVSPRRARAFVAESCAALPDTLLESALFGHVRGAFTGADRARKGLFEAADGGTLFLDEVGEMSPSLQGKLLRVLQEGELRPLGSERTRSVDVRVIGATRRDLNALVRAGSFREDLYYRLAVVSLELPPLRDRPEDIPLLVAFFLEKHARGRKVRIQPSALRLFEQKPWPGNVRELENEVRRALALCESEIEIEHVSSEGVARDREASTGLDLHARTENLTRELVQEALARAAGNVTRAAALLGLSRFGLQKILKRLQLSAK